MPDGTTINGFSVSPPKRATRESKAKTIGQVVTRVRPEDHARLRAVAEREGLSLNDFGVYAMNLALASYGEEPTIQRGLYSRAAS